MTTAAAAAAPPEIDVEGEDTLRHIAEAHRFNRWMYETTSRNLRGRVLEIGSGIGNISAQYLADSRELMLTDLRKHYCDQLRGRFADAPTLLGVREMDLVHPEFDNAYADLLGTFDGVFALNVVEHIADDRRAIENACRLLRPDGRLVILVPAYQRLFNTFDRSLDHFRRYTRASLESLFDTAALQVDRSRYFNLAGIPGWVLFGGVLRRPIIEQGPMKAYEALVPAFRVADRLTGGRVGLSVIVEGVKPG